MKKYYAIIVAGGSGSRMQTAEAKQFLLLDGLPILMHTMKAFDDCILKPQILLVLNIHQQQHWEELCTKYNFSVPHEVVKGGQERYHSVKNALKLIKGQGIVAVHDAVRPLVSTSLIEKSFLVAEEKGNAVAAVHPTDSIRITEYDRNKALNRDMVHLIQTPQTFQSIQLKKAYLQPFRNGFTDDASVVEHAGYEINIIEGERENLKITYLVDLALAGLIRQKKGS
ncbi:2-C-methyl-D-erythritol 4-phosphate cytidylyltransferase [Pedobacter immunditicola]|uniref:2-C-methyl-D-erythritol 4-phosphate cytidylyltransferase n=1 Tax=Pedobacter immunditicola TaxID=3133440 RepID=UPI00309EBF57